MNCKTAPKAPFYYMNLLSKSDIFWILKVIQMYYLEILSDVTLEFCDVTLIGIK